MANSEQQQTGAGPFNRQSTIDNRQSIDASGTRWRAYDVGRLLCELVDGRSLEDIARGMGRTVDACRRQYERLMTGEVECPPEYVATLTGLRKRFKAPASAAGYAATGDREMVEDCLRMLSLLAVVAVFNGRMPGELLSDLPGRARPYAEGWRQALLEVTRLDRKRKAILQARATQSRATQEPVEAPLLMVGPGGDYRQAFSGRQVVSGSLLDMTI
jgi:hypothetical protein